MNQPATAVSVLRAPQGTPPDLAVDMLCPNAWGNGAFVGFLVAGGISAVISVMSRTSFGGLSLDHEAGRRLAFSTSRFRVSTDALGLIVNIESREVH